MDNQFVDLSVPDINAEYCCGNLVFATNLTHLMKLVLCVNKFREATSKIEKILKKYPTEINKKNSLGLTALLIASFNARIYSSNKVVKILLDSGANVDLSEDVYGYTPLVLASLNSNSCSNIETVKLLIDSGSNVNSQTNNGWTALISAARYSNQTSTYDTVKLLIDSGSNVNLQTNDGWTALMVAARNSNGGSTYDTVKLLINSGANVNLQTNDGLTALMLALSNSNTESNINTIKLLIESGADTNIANTFNDTALILYLRNNNNNTINKEILELLIIKSKLTLSVKTIEGKTAYNYYTDMEYTVLDEYLEKLLEGTIVLSNTKSAKNAISEKTKLLH